MGYIYKIVNTVNEKIYIGQTCLNPPEKRWKIHLRDYMKTKMQNRPLYKAMNKYGIDKFKFCIVEEVDDDQLLERERYYIDKFRTYVGFEDSNGYNATLGGDGKHTLIVDKQNIIRCYEMHGVISKVADEFHIDPNTVKKILKQENIVYICGQDKRDYQYYLKYGGIAKVNSDNKILDIYRSVNEVTNENPTYKAKTIGTVLKRGHFSYGYYWYRLIDLPKHCHL